MGEMADFMLLSHYDVDNFDEDDLSGYYRRRYQSYDHRPYDPLYYSRRAAVCEMCGARYKNLCRSVTETAKEARADGWQIERNAECYEWYCPDCKAAHDFESVVNSDNSATDKDTERPADTCKWERISGDEWRCRCCGFVIVTEDSWARPTDKYCRNCGAEMYPDNYPDNYGENY